MDFSLNLKAFLRDLWLSRMSGHEKFLAVAAHNAAGKTAAEALVRNVRQNWPGSVVGQRYNPAFYERAQQEGWIDKLHGKQGVFTVNARGLDHLAELQRQTAGPVEDLQKAGRLVVVNRKSTHSFDKYLRFQLSAATAEVLIADAYVDGKIFDTVLDSTPKNVPMKVLYSRALDTFEAKAERFSKQWTQFSSKKYKHLHDRFMVVDQTGYVLGPSIKDAALNSPAVVVELASSENRLLRNFFNELWQKGTR